MFWFLTSLLCSSCCGVAHHQPPVPAIYYRNNLGQDLLDPATLGHFNRGNIYFKWMNLNGSIGTGAPYTIDQTTIRPDLPYLPNGYRFLIDPTSFKDNNGNIGIISGNTAVVYIQLSTSDTDTVTFTYAGATLQKFLYI